MDKEKIAVALNHFENDEFVQSKEIIQAEINKAKEAYLKDKLGLKGNKEAEESEED
jgi:hypothetical protein